MVPMKHKTFGSLKWANLLFISFGISLKYKTSIRIICEGASQSCHAKARPTAKETEKKSGKKRGQQTNTFTSIKCHKTLSSLLFGFNLGFNGHWSAD